MDPSLSEPSNTSTRDYDGGSRCYGRPFSTEAEVSAALRTAAVPNKGQDLHSDQLSHGNPESCSVSKNSNCKCGISHGLRDSSGLSRGRDSRRL